MNTFVLKGCTPLIPFSFFLVFELPESGMFRCGNSYPIENACPTSFEVLERDLGVLICFMFDCVGVGMLAAMVEAIAGVLLPGLRGVLGSSVIGLPGLSGNLS